MKRILCLDFDGVCHSYTSGWQGADVIPDLPVDGLFEFLEEVEPHFDIHVFSSRSSQVGGREAMMNWFIEQWRLWRERGGKGQEVIGIKFPTEKPPAFVLIDDRCLLFEGIFPSLDTLLNFKTWNKKISLTMF